MINLVLLGAGNVATHLAEAFHKAKEVNLLQVYNHRPKSLFPFERFASTTTRLSHLMEADVYLLALKDDLIPEFPEQLRYLRGLVTHTSGSTGMAALGTMRNYGVFYPLQTFTRKRKISLQDVPICIEASAPHNLVLLKTLARSISKKVYEVDSTQRKSLHLAAVFVNNFTNHLYSQGDAICREMDLPFEILRPLIRETAAKIETLPPFQAQTGPAVRSDARTIASHLDMLEGDRKALYEHLTQSIQKFHGKEL